MSFRILDFRSLRKNSLLGFAKVELPSGLIISDVTILTGERGPWASPPSKAMIGTDGAALRADNGKIRYSPLIEFSSRKVRNAWSNSVIKALQTSHPEAFS